jgi:hypothetical protein
LQQRLLRAAIIGIGMLTLLSACGQTNTPIAQPLAEPAMGKPQPQVQASNPTPAPTAPIPASNQTSTPASTTSIVDNKQLKLKIYYGNENGDKLVEQETNISYKQDDEKYLATLEALSTSADPAKLPLLKGFTFKKVTAQNGLLTMDISMAPESRLGAGGEELLLKALKQTLFQFTEIKSIEVLVDGKAVDSLMGHMELPHPIKR